MKNVQTKVEKGKLMIIVDLSEEHGLSKSGKTVTIASTQGNKEVTDGVYLGLNCYRYPDTE